MATGDDGDDDDDGDGDSAMGSGATGYVTLQLKKLGNLDRYLDIFHLIGVFIRRGPEPNSAAVGTT